MTAKPPRNKSPALADAKLQKIGQAAANLHQLLKELGHTRKLEQSASTMPDARDRLSFIDQSMHEASEKTISAVEASLPLVKSNRAACGALSERMADADFGQQGELASQAVSVLGEIAAAEEVVQHNLMQIMEAQEFRDVAGQMVNKIVLAAVEVEKILVDLLIEYAPDARDSLISTKGLTSGSAVRAGADVAGQDDVDDLLSSLGF